MKGEIKIDGGAITPSLSDLKKNLEKFETELIDLAKTMVTIKSELSGKTYTKLNVTVNSLIDQQTGLLAHEQLIKEEIESYLQDMHSKEKESKSNFNV
ncbi:MULTISPECIES: hypothetical protein [Virgibacillus]|uniref:Uncharacterized protein n=1 Tax=Virgibacillus pantothenticus TaxID=1473 RepID=A0A0L0QN52_VIRPA|nr:MULTISPECIES: hypothetical protein [Virgibacillus]API93671.1 hypothetical protein BKP57_18740 [Virgibacillus sp. 6R]KNE19959.1 hypothetical protein AFK71_16255 [Virgibacillus pantothenticus]MBS7429929.1 hypothetical protein [Virgibacillus sp. 19R1-5]MBU8564973.1 hypothetical protein [Virgibacillus pantothenticus]MBU8599281.1 hypothetical protein [Virgibacillus pantothenticus]